MAPMKRPASAMSGGDGQLSLELPKSFTYFALMTPVGLPSQCLLEIANAKTEGASITMDMWPELKPKTPTGMLPYAVMEDGSAVAESGAIGRAIAGAAGFLGEGKDFIISEMLVGITADLNKKVMNIAPSTFTLKDFDAAKKEAFVEGKPGVIEFLKKYDSMLLPKGDRFTESGMTFGEIDLFCKLVCYAKGPIPEVAEGKLAAFYKRMSEVPGIQKVLDGTSRFGALATYLVPIV